MNRAERRRQEKSARKFETAMRGPYRDEEGVTNDDALAAIADRLGGPPERGALYRVGMRQGLEGRKVQFVGEYVGLAREQSEDGGSEIVMRFAIRNPVMPADSQHGTAENPLILWPLDVWHLQPAQPGDMDTPMHYRMDDEPTHRIPGRPRVQ